MQSFSSKLENIPVKLKHVIVKYSTHKEETTKLNFFHLLKGMR